MQRSTIATSKDVAASGPEPSVIVDKIIADAQSFRLASFGVVDFDLAKGRLVEASFTGAGLPLDSLDRDALAKSPEAIRYTLSLQGS